MRSISLPLRQLEGDSSLTIFDHSNRVVDQQMYDPEAHGTAGGRVQRTGAQDNRLRIRRRAKLHTQYLL